jgi:hypothetical protein
MYGRNSSTMRTSSASFFDLFTQVPLLGPPSGSSVRSPVAVRYVPSYDPTVLRIVRFALLLVLFFLVLGSVIAAGSPETGPIEKSILAVTAVGLLAASVPVHRIGTRS